MDIDIRTNTVPPRAPIEVASEDDFVRLRDYWSRLPMTPKVVASREQAPHVAFPGQDTRILLTGEESAGTVSVFDNYAQAGFVGGDHYQPNEEEYWFILDGEMEFTVGNVTRVVSAGSFAFIPRNCTHAFTLTKDCHIISVNAPAGHDRAFEALDKLFRDGKDVAPDTPARTVANHQMVLYLDRTDRHPIDQRTNIEPDLSIGVEADETARRRAWSALPMIPKIVARREDARDVSAPGLDARLLVGPEESAGRYSMLDLIVAPGFEAPVRRLQDEDQWWYVIEGDLDVTVGSVQTRLGPGGFAYSPRGSAHALTNTSGRPVHMISVHSPGGCERRLVRQ